MESSESYISRSPHFSIIIPNYNYARYLEQAIQSVVSQDYPHKELIVIDGGSIDGSVEVIKKYEDQITYWISEKDTGTYDANNKGLKQISGDYWCILNSDDILLPGALTTIANRIAQHSGNHWFVGGEYIIDENDTITNEIFPKCPAPIEGFTFLDGCWISHPCVFIHRDVIREVGYFERWHIMDYNYWLRMEAAGYFPVLIPERVAALRMHSECKSYDQISLYKEALNIRISFCRDKGLLSSRVVKKKIKQELTNITRIKIAYLLAGGDTNEAMRLVFSSLIQYPSLVADKWVWGCIKRILFGLRKNDPIFEMIPKRKGTATWEYK